MIKDLFSKESKSIVGAAFIIAFTTILSRVLGLVRDRLLVSHFHVGDALDAYYASFQLPNFIFALLILGTLSVAFIPVFTAYLAEGKREEAWHVANAVMTITMVAMAVVCFLLFLGAPLIVRFTAPGFSGQKLALTVQLTRIMMLSPFFFAISAVCSSVLNSFKQFLIVSLAPLLYNASIIFGIVFLTKPFGIAGVAYGAILGAMLHILIQIPGLMALGMRWRPRLDFRHKGVREIWRLFLPRVFGVDISQITQFIGTTIGTTLGTGAVALYTLSVNMEAVPVGVFAIPFAIAAFPSMSEAYAKGDRGAFARLFASTFRQIVFCLAPLTAMAWVLRLHVIRGIIGSKGLSWNDTRLAAASLAFFVVSLVFQGLTPLFARAFYSLKNTYIPVIVSAIAVAVNVGLTFLLIGAFRQGAFVASFNLMLGLFGVPDLRMLALPIAFSCASILQVALLAAILRKKFGPIGGRGLALALLKFGAGAIAAAWATWAVIGAMGGIDDVTSVLQALVQAVASSVVGLGAYVLVLKLLRSEELDAMADAVRRKIAGARRPLPAEDAERL